MEQPPAPRPEQSPPEQQETVGAVVFDIGNVLVRWDPAAAVAAEVGPERARAFVDDPEVDFLAWNSAQDAGRTWDEGEREALARLPHYAREIPAYRRHFALALPGPIEDTVAVLRELHAAGVRLFALTNFSHELFPAARERFDFLGLFEDVVVSGEERLVKPDPRIFAVLARRVEHVAPLSRCVFVDDSAANVEAARAVGMDAILFTDTGHLRDDLRERGLPLRPA